jgi:putative ABC transport system permease protein
MFYIMLFITLNKGLAEMPGADALIVIMWMGVVVIGLFSVIILLYTNSFLMKRRKKELGLYNILGMGKNHIARVMAIENIYVSVGSIFAGLSAGILLSKLMLMLLLKLLRFKVPFGFEISPIALIVTVVVFAGIFFITLLSNLGRVHLSKPIELLYGGNVGEKEPKTKWVLAVIGFLALGIGYTIAIVTENPIDALGWFFIAVLLVILGTYCLFTAGSIALLKSLRRNKSYYYKTNHFTSVSGMIYRMKQNAVGLSNICILSTMVLVMLSTTVSLYIGMEDALRNRFPRDIEITASDINREGSGRIGDTADAFIRQSGSPVLNFIEYRYKLLSLSYSDTVFSNRLGSAGGGMTNATAIFIPLEDYNRLQGTDAALSPHELLLCSPGAAYDGSAVSFGTETFAVKSTIKSLNIGDSYTYRINETFYLIVPDEQAIHDIFNALTDGQRDWTDLSYYYGFDVTSDDSGKMALTNQLRDAYAKTGSDSEANTVYVTGAAENKNMFLSIYGGLFFLGIFLGALFMMATVIIMYYKQISEGYDDKKRFEIMQKVGLSHSEIKKTIRSQVLTVFFLPLLAAGIHILAAFKMITKLLFQLNLTNVSLFAWCTLGTIIIFAVIYGIVYTLTAKAYYKIVS